MPLIVFLIFLAYPGAPQAPPTGFVPAPPHPAAAYAGKVLNVKRDNIVIRQRTRTICEVESCYFMVASDMAQHESAIIK